MDFYQRMAIICAAIPRGAVASYGQIALLCGAPRNARQVGYALREDRTGPGIPAHRIVNAKGELSGAEYFLVRNLQRDLLAEEGVPAAWNGKQWQVDLERYGWKPSAEDMEAFSAQK